MSRGTRRDLTIPPLIKGVRMGFCSWSLFPPLIKGVRMGFCSWSLFPPLIKGVRMGSTLGLCSLPLSRGLGWGSAVDLCSLPLSRGGLGWGYVLDLGPIKHALSIAQHLNQPTVDLTHFSHSTPNPQCHRLAENR
ncbi:hypothetical protein DFP75_10718 [Marinomonas alcarazii]|uniref:Uncharacterized protein n=1 Tax=Marinomonas alcarazii TaxID=491949 RepID=A0A318UV92_9GAMM|nr:hypothetical protein DFP75_10718 [Marinomonas alcarazii]